MFSTGFSNPMAFNTKRRPVIENGDRKARWTSPVIVSRLSRLLDISIIDSKVV